MDDPMLSALEKKKLQVLFTLYSGDGVIDAVDVIDAMYCLDLNPTHALMVTITGTDQRGVKKYNIDEFADVYKILKTNKDEGGFHDFVEFLKNFDTNKNGMMKAAELYYMLQRLGEQLADEQIDSIFNECMLEEEDDDGFIPYEPFLCRLCDHPVPPGFHPAKKYLSES